MFSSNQKIIAAIDVGGSKIVSLIAKVSSEGSINLLGVGNKASEGIRHGLVSDVKLARAAIASSIYEAEQAARKNVDTIIVNISSPFVKSNLIKVTTKLGGKQILARDLKKVADTAIKNVDLSKYEVLDCAALSHDLDEMENISDPEFMFANLLASYVNVVTVPIKSLINFSSCLLGCQLKISDFVIGAYASALVCATEEERVSGCVVVDLGGELLEYVVIKNNQIIDCGAIPLGGKVITKDIANYFSISLSEAERVKILNGTLYDFAYDEDSVIKINMSNSHDFESNGISNALLNKVIKARFEETINIFINQIGRKKMNKECFGNLIFTGGGSNLAGIEDFIQNKFGLKIKKEHYKGINLSEDFDISPSFSTALGLIKYHTSKSKTQNSNYSLDKIFSWLKQNF